MAEIDKYFHLYGTKDKIVFEEVVYAQPEQCEDAVSRKDAIRWVKTECNPYGKPTLDFESGKKVIEHLERMSAVTPKRKKGKWTNENACEFCGFQPWYERDIHTLSFCPNCGADMKGEKDEQR